MTSDELKANGPYPKEKIKRIWKTNYGLAVILSSSGWDRFSLKEGEKDYDHYLDILNTHADRDGWIGRK